MESTEARITAHPGHKHEARRFQLLSLRLKVAQYRAMEQELVGFLRADEAAPAKPALRSKPAPPAKPRRRTAPRRRRT